MELSVPSAKLRLSFGAYSLVQGPKHLGGTWDSIGPKDSLQMLLRRTSLR